MNDITDLLYLAALRYILLVSWDEYTFSKFRVTAEWKENNVGGV